MCCQANTIWNRSKKIMIYNSHVAKEEKQNDREMHVHGMHGSHGPTHKTTAISKLMVRVSGGTGWFTQ